MLFYMTAILASIPTKVGSFPLVHILLNLVNSGLVVASRHVNYINSYTQPILQHMEGETTLTGSKDFNKSEHK